MSVAFRATPAYGTAGSSPFTVTKQTGTASGDWIFIYALSTQAPPQTASCTGFSEVHAQSGGTGASGSLLYRRADGGEGASFSVTFPGGGVFAYGIATLSGAGAALDPATPPNPGSPASGTTIPVTAITLAGTGETVLWFGGTNDSGGLTIAVPAAFTQDGSAGLVNPTVAIGHSTGFGSGSTGTQTGNISGGSGWSSGVMVALVPTGTPAAVTGIGAPVGTAAPAGTPSGGGAAAPAFPGMVSRPQTVTGFAGRRGAAHSR